jgi:hypothetical protein
LAAAWAIVALAGAPCHAEENLWFDMARASITSGELHDHAGLLADDMLEGREGGSRGGLAAAKYLVSRLKDSGLQPAGDSGGFIQRFRGNHQNLLAMLPGSDPQLSSEYIVVGAHYDHVGYGNRRNSYGPFGYIHNGADDNASGVAALLEVIDAFSRTQYRPRRSVLFALWDGEEEGLIGSKYWLSRPTVPLSGVKVNVNIDMVGRLRDGRLIIGGVRNGAGFRQLMSSPQLDPDLWLDFSWDYKENSDHWSFYQRGIPAMYVHTGLHDDYHRPSDDVEKLNFEGIRLVSCYLLDRVAALADADALPSFRPCKHETIEGQKKIERQPAPLPARIDFTCQFQPSPESSLAVSKLKRGGAAERAGLQVGDRIIKSAGQPPVGVSHFSALVGQSDSPLELEVLRSTSAEPVKLSLPLAGSPVQVGLSWREDPAEPGAVYITRVIPHSPAERAGLKPLDRIYSLEGQPVAGQQSLFAKLKELLDAGRQQLHFTTESRGRIEEVNISLELPPGEAADAVL